MPSLTELAELIAVSREVTRRLEVLATERLAAEMTPAVEHRVEPADPAIWYEARVKHLEALGATSSRREDAEAAAAAGFAIGREELRRIRRELAPASWSEPGRPRRDEISVGHNCHICRPIFGLLTVASPVDEVLHGVEEDVRTSDG